MRAVFVFALSPGGCSTRPTGAPPPTPTPSATSTTAAPSPTPTASSSPTPTPISLPSIAQLSSPSGTVVWALVGGTRLFRSSDRGDTWAERSLPTGLANIEVAFVDDRSGLLLAGGSPATQCQTQTVTIWRTTNGAATWQQLGPTGIPHARARHWTATG